MTELKNNKMPCKKNLQLVIGMYKHPKFKYNLSSKHKAISDVIVTLLLIAGTIVTGAIVFSFFSGPDSPTAVVETSQDRPSTTPRDIIISGYDTRDGDDIGSTSTFDNSNSDTDDALKPGEYISLTVRDRGQGDISIITININEIRHTWEATSWSITTSNNLGAISGCTSAFDNGEFIIIGGGNPASSGTTNDSQLIPQGQEKRVIVKLSDDLANIGLNKSIRVAIIVANFEPTEFIISAGGTR